MSDLGTLIAGIGAMIIIFLILGWVIITIPVYLAAKLFGSDASFLKAMVTVLLAGILAGIIIIIFAFISAAYGSFILAISGLIIAFIAVLGVYKSMFNVGWAAAFGIIIVSIIIAFIFNLILSLFGIGIFYLLGSSQLQSVISPLSNLTNIFQSFNLG
jgi:hypothetical protein